MLVRDNLNQLWDYGRAVQVNVSKLKDLETGDFFQHCFHQFDGSWKGVLDFNIVNLEAL